MHVFDLVHTAYNLARNLKFEGSFLKSLETTFLLSMYACMTILCVCVTRDRLVAIAIKGTFCDIQPLFFCSCYLVRFIICKQLDNRATAA